MNSILPVTLRRCVVVPVILFLLSLAINAQEMTEKTAKTIFKHQFGLHAGTTTGVGISYRYWPGKLGFQLTLLPIKVDSSWNDVLHITDFIRALNPTNDDGYSDEPLDEKFISIGLSGLYTFKQAKRFKAFAYLGNHLFIDKDGTKYNVGAGIGFAIEAPVSFNFMIGYGAYDVLDKLNLLPAGEMGLYYRF